VALASDQHLFATYQLVDSWTLGYNLFADVWLRTNVVESSVGVCRFLFYLDVHWFSDLRWSK